MIWAAKNKWQKPSPLTGTNMISKFVREGALALAGRIAVGLAVAMAASVGANAQSSPPSQFVVTDPLFLSNCISFPGNPACNLIALNASGYARENVNSAVDAHRSATTSHIQTTRDEIQAWMKGGRAGQFRAPGFAADPAARTDFGPFDALAYSKTGMVTKARPMAPAVNSGWIVSGWAQGSADHEDRDLRDRGVNVSTNTRSYTGVGGIDFVKIGVATSSDALVIGFLGMYTDSRTDNFFGDVTKSETPGGGLYVAYIAGGFSVDYSFLANFTDSNVRTAGGFIATGIGTDSYVTTANMQYKYDIPASAWWVEPTVGYSYTSTYSNVFGTTTGHSLRFQGGARAGTEWAWGTAKVQPTIMAVAYSDVNVEVPTIPPAIFVGLTDQGYLWGKGTGKLNVQWTDKFSTYIEGEIRGRADVVGYAGRLAARLTF